MYLHNINNSFNYELEKLCRIFLPFEKIVFTNEPKNSDIYAETKLKKEKEVTYLSAELCMHNKKSVHKASIDNSVNNYLRECEILLATQLFKCFSDITGYKSEWGILTGVRPAKLYSSLCSANGKEAADREFAEKFLVSSEKISLCAETYKTEQEIIKNSAADSFSLYISIPFCPTRCSYCSFVSHSVDKSHKLIPEYVDKLIEEIKYTAQIANLNGLKLKTVYIGGGTPTTLEAGDLSKIMQTVKENFDLSNPCEYTVEAGRPDTITEEKLRAILFGGATRISINPQTMSDDVLQRIGRRHTTEQTVSAYLLARKVGFNNINMDLIAGLPGDTFDNFCDTIEKVIALNPENVTVHSLSFKRAANLSTDAENEYISGTETAKMVRYATARLTETGIFPYYMYRQSKTVGNLENVGYAKKGFEGLYNVYIMDETHTILACGASGVTKLREPYGNYIERIFNFKYPYEYISNFKEIINRKENINIFYKTRSNGYGFSK